MVTPVIYIVAIELVAEVVVSGMVEAVATEAGFQTNREDTPSLHFVRN